MARNYWILNFAAKEYIYTVLEFKGASCFPT